MNTTVAAINVGSRKKTPKMLKRENEKQQRSQVPPPAPPGPVGSLPATRLQSEVGQRSAEPPLVVQNAMMTKDKKPFTYTPGGIDLTEIRSPRMARRLEKNAASEGVQLPPQVMQNQCSGPLPPSALAAMQPAMPVQVFPDGQIPQLGKGGAPPPPPPPGNVAAPPPPPMQTNKQANRKSAVSPIPQTYERPDMTKIIPENPMALLRKSPGPVVKQDPILNRDNYVNAGINPIGGAPEPRNQIQQQQSPEIVRPKPQMGTVYIPPAEVDSQTVSTPPGTLKRQNLPFEYRQVQSPPVQPSTPPYVAQKQNQSPPVQPSTPPYTAQKQNQSPPITETKVRSPPIIQKQPPTPETPGSPKVNLNKAPTPWLSQKPQPKDVPPWAVNEQGADLPKGATVANQTGPVQEPSPQFPGGARIIPTPVAQPESPQQRFVSNHNVSPGSNQNFATPVQGNVVIVNDPPIVYQAPGPSQKLMYLNQPGVQQQRSQANQPRIQQQPQQQQPRVDSSGARIIPIQVEGSSNNAASQPSRPYVQKVSGAPPPIESRPAYNRQQSQSNSFRVLQKITNTDVDTDDEPAIEVGPRSAQQFQQRHIPADQLRQMKLSEDDQEFVSRFRQVAYNQPVNRMQQQSQVPSQPQVRERTIPIQIEGESVPRKYVPPSEQKVPEPKKYTGSAIPSRSFKILQAMTAPENCADPEPDTENYSNDPSSSLQQWGYDPNYPFPPHFPFPPHANRYRRNCRTPTIESQKLNQRRRFSKNSNKRNSFPFFMTQEDEYFSEYESDTSTASRQTSHSRMRGSTPLREFESDIRTQRTIPRHTPVPFWPYYSHPFDSELDSEELEETESISDAFHFGPPYPPVWDPYSYYPYYYGPFPHPRGRPPMFSPYMFCPPPMNDSEDGYSTADDSTYFSKPASRPSSTMKKRCETPIVGHTSTTEKYRSTAPVQEEVYVETFEETIEENCPTESLEKECDVAETTQKSCEKSNSKEKYDSSDESDTESNTDSEEKNYQINPLTTIASVANVKVYDVDQKSDVSEEESVHEEEISEHNNEPDDPSSVCYNDNTMPHILSTIDELSERTDLTDSKQMKELNYASDDETTADISESEDDNDDKSEVLVTLNVPLKLKRTVSDNRNETMVLTAGNKEIKENISTNSEHTSEIQTSFTLRSPSREKTPKRNDISDSTLSKRNSYIKVNEDITKQSSSEYCESQENEHDANMKIVKRETQMVTEKVTIGPDGNFEIDDTKQEDGFEISKDEVEDDVDWWGKLSEDKDAKQESGEDNNSEITVMAVTEGKHSPDEEEEKCTSSQDKENQSEHVEESKELEDKDEDEEEVDFWAEIMGSKQEEEIYTKRAPVFTRYNYEEEETKEEVQIEGDIQNSSNSSNNSSNTSETENAESSIIYNDRSCQPQMEDVNNENSNTFPFVAQDATNEKCINSEDEREVDEQEVDKQDNIEQNEEQEKEALSFEHYSETQPQNVHYDENSDQSLKTSTIRHQNSFDCKEDINVSVSSDDSEKPEVPLSIKERIKALEQARRSSASQPKEEDQEVKVSVKERISAFEENHFLLSVDSSPSKRSSLSRKSSVRSFEECSEVEDEEVDSGVTSDISKHVSEPEADQDFPNLRKMNQYQRASTHSRLFKLLQEECEAEDEAERLNAEAKASQNPHPASRDHLDLPLQKHIPEMGSGASSGFNSPASPVINEGLVNELITSLLMKNQAKAFRKMPMERLQAAAVKILKEDADAYQLSPEEFASYLSSTANCTADSTAIQTPQEFYSSVSDYSHYYDSWGEPDHSYYLAYDIVPSKAFKLIQEHTAMNKTGAITGLNAKCPRVLSSKNVPKEVNSSPSPEPDSPGCPTQQNEVASAS